MRPYGGISKCGFRKYIIVKDEKNICYTRMIDMRIEDLKIFVDVVQNHSMNIAAEKNFTSPQNLSKIIKRMEDELGVVLFKRSKKGSDLTKEGENFYLHINDVLKSYKEALESISIYDIASLDENKENNINSYEKINVLCSQGILSYIVTEVFRDLENHYNNLRFEDNEINFYSSDKVVEYINNNSFDLIACIVKSEDIERLTTALSEEYVLMHVFFDEMVLIISKDNFLGSRSVISAEDIRKLNLISFKDNMFYDDLFQSGFSYQILTNSVSKALDLIRRSKILCTILCKSMIRLDRKKFGTASNLKMVQIKEKEYSTYVILLNKRSVHDNIMMEFVNEISEFFLKE